MNLLAIVGSSRKGKSTNMLVDKAIEGVQKNIQDISIKKIYLSDCEVGHCKDCLTCWKSKTDEPVAQCVIRDDMDIINQEIIKSDLLILGTPIHMGYASGLMTTFLERICWTFAKPTKSYGLIKGCPAPRSTKKREAVIIATSGMIPPRFKQFCNWATPQITGVIKDSLNARTVGKLYAGNIWNRRAEHYFVNAEKLGEKLAKKVSRGTKGRVCDQF